METGHPSTRVVETGLNTEIHLTGSCNVSHYSIRLQCSDVRTVPSDERLTSHPTTRHVLIHAHTERQNVHEAHTETNSETHRETQCETHCETHCDRTPDK